MARRVPRSKFVWIACWFLFAAAPIAREETVVISVSPHVTREPGEASVRVVVPPSPANRTLVLAIDGPEFYRSSAIALDTRSTDRIITMKFGPLPPGAYVVEARLLRADGGDVLNTDHIDVLGRTH